LAIFLGWCRLGILTELIALVLALPGAAVADPAAPVAVTIPSDSVRCVYDQMSTEDREMSLLLFEREVASETKIHAGSRNLKVIDRLVEEARAKCSSPFGWSGGRSDAAIGYAMNELMAQGVVQALEAKGHDTAQIDLYYGQHRAELAGVVTIDGTKSEEFRAYLLDHGWVEGETATLGIAEFYLESLIARDGEAKSFAAAAIHPVAAVRKASASRPPSRARTARRGKP
jgi:hypothetical protein